MNERNGVLTEKDHDGLDDFFKRVLDLYKFEKATSEDLIATIGQVIGAIDAGNVGEVRAWTANPGNLEATHSGQ
ncbi:hypothetical protein [uncultured Alcanivorax sp.]|uniref:hypothetical protein n=1 Tax=uncultured Alcanivorax sp. TaxID=191215 RepID=UPI0032B2348B